jgi:hypothetical protein
MFKKVLYVFVVISFILSVLTVRWYSRKFVLKKEKPIESAAHEKTIPEKDIDSESDPDSGSEKLKPESKKLVKSVFNQTKEDKKMYTELYNDMIAKKKQ